MVFFTFLVVGGAGSRKSCRLAEAGSVGIFRELGPLGRSGLTCTLRAGPALNFEEISGFGGVGVALEGPLKAKLNFDEFC